METGRGKSAYQSYRDTTNDNPILTEAQWVASLDGPAGPPGPAGGAGPKGDTGNTGPKGDTGNTGLPGAKGDTGDAGPKGDTGDPGPQGDIGYPGFKYDVRRVNANGVQYVPGEIIEYQGSYFICIATNDAAHPSDAAYWSPYSFVGPKGDQGDPGPSGSQGDPGPAGPEATPITNISDDGGGNLTISTQNSSYGPFALKGPAGGQGAQGDPGPPGSNGQDGTNATPITNVVDDGNGNLTFYTDLASYGPFALKGSTGNNGDPGPKGDTGDTGGTGPGFYWLNAYIPGNGYVPGAVVRGSDNNLYVATGSGELGDPTSSGGWDLYLPKGTTGDAGPKGDTGDTGPMPYNYRGAWSGSTSYTLYDAVTHDGSLYWLPATGGWTIGGAPPDFNWELLVSKGDTGEQGETGKSAYQSYLDTTTDDPVLTEEEWSAGGGAGGDYLPLAGGTMDVGAEISFTNSARIRQTPSDYGLDLVCSIDYVHRWKNGSLYILDQSNGIRSVQYGLTFEPTQYFDTTQGYLVGSRFIKDDGTVFECTDNTENAAVWVDVTPLTEVEVTSTTATDITGLLKGNGSVVSAATAGTDYVATDDARLTDARTPTAHTHAGDTLGPVEKLQFDTTPTGAAATVGDLIWNIGEETLDLQLHGFTMHTGQHVIYHAQNNTGETIAKGTPVMFAGTTGNSGKLRIKPWDGIGPATLFMGITGEQFIQGHEGSVVAFGKVRGIQTNGGNYSQTWADETIIYAGTNSVKLTSVKPSAPNPIVEVMAVVSAHGSNGAVFVRPNYFTADVFGPSSVADNAIARFDGTTGKLIQSGGITIADNATGTLSGTNSGDVTLGGTPAYLTIANQVITRNQVSLTAASAHVTGTLPVANGGTGQTALSSIDAADFGSGAAADNYVLTADGSGGAAWEAASGGGGSSITGTGFAYVRTGGSATPTIGNPALPFPTGQAAWDAGATRFDFGPGSFSIDAAFGSGGYSLPVYFQGAGLSGSFLTLTWRGEDGVEQNGFTAPDLNLSSDKSITIQIAIEGGDATSAGSDTYNGGNIANHYFSNCYIQGLTLTAGAGCNGGTTGADASSSGAEFTNIVTGALQGSTIYKNAILEAGIFSPDKLSDGNKGSISVTTNGEAWSINENVIQFSNLTTASAKGKIIGRKTAGAGNFEECAITDFTHVTEHYMRTIDFFDSTGIVSNVTGLSCPVAENEKVLIEIVGFRVGGAAGSGLKISFSGPDSPTDVRYTLEHWNAVNTGRTVAAATSFNSVLTQADGNTDSLPIRVTLTLINGPNAQTVQFRAGSEGSGTSITLPKGLTMRVHRIP